MRPNLLETCLFFIPAQFKEKTYKASETVQFQSSYKDFVKKFLETHFPDRFVDFKNVECVIEELYNLYKDISKEDKIAPFNPNLPVLNISGCNDVVRLKSLAQNIFKSPNMQTRNKKKSQSRTQIEVKAKGKKLIGAGNIGDNLHCCLSWNRITNCATDQSDSDDDSGKQIAENIENLFNDDTFSPRYKAKHSSDLHKICRETVRKTDSTIFNTLEKEAIEQYDSVDDDIDMNFNLLENDEERQENEI